GADFSPQKGWVSSGLHRVERLLCSDAVTTLLPRPALYGFAASVLALICRFAVCGAEEPDSEEAIDHAGILRSWNADSLARGEKLYNSICITCHGTLTQAGSLPTSRPFWKEPFKNGSDPLSLYKTLSDGL